MNETLTTEDRDWPRSVDAAVVNLLEQLSAKDKTRLASMPEQELLRLHHGWGTGIRNAFGLWKQNRELMESCVELGGPHAKHPDRASGVIIKAVWNQLTGHPREYHQWVVDDIFLCATCDAVVEFWRWRDDGPILPQGLLCRDCEWKALPEFAQREKENEIARAAFENARRLGEQIHALYAAAGGGAEDAGHSTDRLLLLLALHACKDDEAFDELWWEVKGEEPSEKHLPWLRLWKTL